MLIEIPVCKVESMQKQKSLLLPTTLRCKCVDIAAVLQSMTSKQFVGLRSNLKQDAEK